jgi:hypothetical protein
MRNGPFSATLHTLANNAATRRLIFSTCCAIATPHVMRPHRFQWRLFVADYELKARCALRLRGVCVDAAERLSRVIGHSPSLD